MQNIDEKFLKLLNDNASAFSLNFIAISDEQGGIIYPKHNNVINGLYSFPCIIKPYIDYVNELLQKSKVGIIDVESYNVLKPVLDKQSRFYILTDKNIIKDDIDEYEIYINDLNNALRGIKSNCTIPCILSSPKYMGILVKYIDSVIVFECDLSQEGNPDGKNESIKYSQLGTLEFIKKSDKMITNYFFNSDGCFYTSTVKYIIKEFKSYKL